MEAEREFQFLEVIGTNVLANEVRHFSNLTAKECWESAKRVKHALGGIIDFELINTIYTADILILEDTFIAT